MYTLLSVESVLFKEKGILDDKVDRKQRKAEVNVYQC